MHHDVAREQAVVRVDIDASHDDFLFFGNDVGDVAHNADVVVADDAQGGGILTAALAAPTSLDDAIAETLAQFGALGQSARCILMPPETVTKPKTGSP